ncbi:MAG: hypothetical protein Q9191_007812, partial [Dirinaria sp. TL-2023a]
SSLRDESLSASACLLGGESHPSAPTKSRSADEADSYHRIRHLEDEMNTLRVQLKDVEGQLADARSQLTARAVAMWEDEEEDDEEKREMDVLFGSAETKSGGEEEKEEMD